MQKEQWFSSDPFIRPKVREINSCWPFNLILSVINQSLDHVCDLEVVLRVSFVLTISTSVILLQDNLFPKKLGDCPSNMCRSVSLKGSAIHKPGRPLYTLLYNYCITLLYKRRWLHKQT